MEFSKNKRRKMRRRGSLEDYYHFFVSVFLYGREKDFLDEVDFMLGPTLDEGSPAPDERRRLIPRFSLTGEVIPFARAEDPELAPRLEAGVTRAIEVISRKRVRG